MKRAFLYRRVTEPLGLPPELIPKVPKITLSGDSAVLIENHGGLKSLSEEHIEVGRRGGLVRINGTELQLAAMTASDIVVRGFIISVELC